MAWSVSSSAAGQASAPQAPPVPKPSNPAPKQDNGLLGFWNNLQQAGIGAVNVHNVLSAAGNAASAGAQVVKSAVQSAISDAQGTFNTAQSIIGSIKDQATANALLDASNKQVASLKTQYAQGKINQQQYSQGLTQVSNALAFSSKTLKNGEIMKIDPIKAAAQAASTFLNIVPVGEGVGALKDIATGLDGAAVKEGATGLAAQFAKQTGESTVQKIVGTVAKEGATSSVYGTMQPLADKGSKATQSDVSKSTAVGTFIGGGLGTLGELFGMGASKVLDKIKNAPAKVADRTTAGLDKLMPGDVSEALPKKINVQDVSTATKGTSSSGLPDTTVKAADNLAKLQKEKPYNDTNFRLAFKTPAQEIVKSMPKVAQTSLLTGKRDALDITIQHLADNPKSDAKVIVDKLLPGAGEDKSLISQIHDSGSAEDIKKLLYDKSQSMQSQELGTIKPSTKITFSDEDFTKQFDDLKAAHAKETQVATLKGKSSDIPDINAKYEKSVDSLVSKYKTANADVAKSKETTVAESKPILKTAKQVAADNAKKQAAKEEATAKLTVSTGKNQEPKTLLDKASSKLSHGVINPARSAANRGNTEFVDRVTKAVNEANLGAKQAKDFGENLNKNVTDHAATIKEIEAGVNSSKAAQLFNEKAGSSSELAKNAKNLGVVKGLQKNYFPRFAEFPKKVGNSFKNGVDELFNKSGVSRGGALSKTVSNSKSRALQDVIDENGNVVGKELKYKTHADFVKAAEEQGGHVITNVGAAGEKYYANMTKAVANAKLMQDLKTTAMADGQPAVMTLKKGIVPPEARLKGYTTLNGLEGYAVHPEAKPLLNAVANGAKSSNGAYEAIARLNSLTKKLVTLNGVVHLKNEALSSMRNQGIFNTLKAMTLDIKSPEAQATVERAISNGYLPNSLNKMNLYDELNKVVTKTSPASKITGALSKPQEAMSKFIFETFGDRTGLATYANTEKKLLAQGFSAEEAGKIAANRANDTIFAVPTQERSIQMKNASRLALFAGQYFQRTLKIGSEAIGLGTDRTLSPAAQKASQRLAIKSLATGASQLFLAAQAINYATTGHSTFENNGDKLDPVLWVDKNTGKEYHATNFYGQLGEVLKLVPGPTLDLSALTNKMAPGLQTAGDVIFNHDPYTGEDVYNRNDPNWKQALDMFGEVLKNTATPAGFNLSGEGINQTLSTPGGGFFSPLTGAKMLGYGTSSNNRNSFQNDIYNRYVSTLPQGDQQTTLQDMQLSNLKSAARNDLQKGKTDTANIRSLEAQMTTSQFKTFLKTGASDDTQRYFDALPNEQKLQVIENNSPSDLKSLDMSAMVKSLFTSSSMQSLTLKGFSAQRIGDDLKKVGIKVGS